MHGNINQIIRSNIGERFQLLLDCTLIQEPIYDKEIKKLFNDAIQSLIYLLYHKDAVNLT